MKPGFYGTTEGQLSCGGYDPASNEEQLWVWKYNGEETFGVSKDQYGSIVAEGLTRSDAAKLGGLLLLDPNCYCVRLYGTRKGDWHLEGGGK